MSGSVAVVLPQLNLNQIDEPLHKVVVKGNKQFTMNTISADTENANQCVFSFQPPSQNTIIDRRFLLSVQVDLVKGAGAWTNNQDINRKMTNQRMFPKPSAMNGASALTFQTADNLNNTANNTAGGTPIQVSRNELFAPRQLPLMSIIDVIDIEINGTHISVSPKDYIHALMRYTTPKFREEYLSGSPSYPDVNSRYQTSYPNANSPFGVEGSVGRKGELPRGYVHPVLNGTTATYTFTEPLFISPLLVGGEFEGLTNINQLNVNIRWSADKLRMFSIYDVSGTSAIVADRDLTTNLPVSTNLTATLKANSANLLLNYYTAQDDIKIPNEVVYPYNQPQLYTKSFTQGALASKLQSPVIVGDNIRINQIPQKMYVFVNDPRATRTITNADFQYTISKVNVNWNNQTGLLSGSTPYQLHQINKSNGLDCDYSEYMSNLSGVGSGVIGSEFGVPLCLEFGKDIPLETGETAGMIGNYNLRVDVNFLNCRGIDIGAGTNLEYNVLLVMNGACIISPNEMRLTLGNVDRADSMNAVKDGTEYSEVKQDGNVAGLQGGSFLGGFKHMLKRGGKVARKVAEACDKYAPMMKQGASAVGGSEVGGNYVGGTYSGGRR